MSDQVRTKRHAFAAAGLDRDMVVVRMPTYSNEVWIGDDLVIRIDHRASSWAAPRGRLVREAAVAAGLSADVRCPEIMPPAPTRRSTLRGGSRGASPAFQLGRGKPWQLPSGRGRRRPARFEALRRGGLVARRPGWLRRLGLRLLRWIRR
ncbi:MAG TPA: hypothetical protein VGD37_05985 [Kofleriaceae bacterium]